MPSSMQSWKRPLRHCAPSLCPAPSSTFPGAGNVSNTDMMTGDILAVIFSENLGNGEDHEKLADMKGGKDFFCREVREMVRVDTGRNKPCRAD